MVLQQPLKSFFFQFLAFLKEFLLKKKIYCFFFIDSVIFLLLVSFFIIRFIFIISIMAFLGEEHACRLRVC